MVKRILPFASLLLPLALFVGALYKVRQLFDREEGLLGIGIMLGALATMAAIVGLMLKFWLLPTWGRAISERVYAGSYLPDEDPIVSLAQEIRKCRDWERMAEFEKRIMQDSSRARAWMEYFSLLSDVFQAKEAALQALLKGAEYVRSKEEKAMFLYRSALYCEKKLNDLRQARSLFEQAARRFPRTAYGKQAALRLS